MSVVVVVYKGYENMCSQQQAAHNKGKISWQNLLTEKKQSLPNPSSLAS